MSVWDVARGVSQVDDERLACLFTLARQQALEGAFIELGVYQGGSALVMAQGLAEAQSPYRLHLLDSWRGLPALASEDAGCIARQGTFADASEANVSALLQRCGLGQHCALHSGWIADTLPPLAGPFALAHVDLDLYGPTLQALAHLLPRMTERGLLVVDDYGGERFPGVRQAVQQALVARPDWCLCHLVGEHDQAAVLARRV